MTLHQTLKLAPTRTNELLARLADTSNNAVKTREKLLPELSAELQLYIELESQHLVPVLRKHEATKGLVADVATGTKALRARLAELEAAPKDADAFIEKLTELRQVFQKHLRDERNELLPAISKALEAEEAQTLAASIEATIAEAGNAKREEAKEAKDAGRQAREAADAEAKAERTAARAQKAAEQNVREVIDRAVNIGQLEAAAAQDAGRQITQAMTSGVEQATISVSDALSTYRHSAQEATEDLRAVSMASSLSARGLAEIGSAWGDWLNKAARTNAEATRRLLQCRTLQQVAEAQSEFGGKVMRNWMETNVQVLQVAQQTAKQALKALDGRLGSSA